MALRLFQGAPETNFQVDSSLNSKSLLWRVPEEPWRLISSGAFQKQLVHVKASQNTSALTTNADTNEKNATATLQKKNVYKSTFPSGFQTLVEEVCDQTDVAELKLKVGDFEMLLKRDTGNSDAPISDSAPIESPITAPPIPNKPMVETVSSPSPVAEQESAAAASSSFTNTSAAMTLKLAALDASEQNAYVLVSSSTVGLFQRGRTLKGERQPPSCEEGDIIKEGQIIGFLDQFGNELPVRSDVAGEVLKIIYEDGEAVGYGDPLVAVLPSFHGIK
ncbi:hypothetical protein OPV22_009681 [Ensete ventricosum]|uniref:Lipoyl-binding domain-containing protein n=1 Tax=Ensete ventricosum TaxID=4639 RepID=A0AAV8RBD8_ENSVE|nr:hypothetical protein OPV22_009681 [Ensete ventricosum]